MIIKILQSTLFKTFGSGTHCSFRQGPSLRVLGRGPFYGRRGGLTVSARWRSGFEPWPGHCLQLGVNLVPRVLRLLGQRFGRQERLWGNGIFSIFLIGYSGNNEIGEAEVGSMSTDR